MVARAAAPDDVDDEEVDELEREEIPGVNTTAGEVEVITIVAGATDEPSLAADAVTTEVMRAVEGGLVDTENVCCVVIVVPCGGEETEEGVVLDGSSVEVAVDVKKIVEGLFVDVEKAVDEMVVGGILVVLTAAETVKL